MFPMTPLQSRATVLLTVILVLFIAYVLLWAISKVYQMQERRRKKAALRARNEALREAIREVHNGR